VGEEAESSVATSAGIGVGDRIGDTAKVSVAKRVGVSVGRVGCIGTEVDRGDAAPPDVVVCTINWGGSIPSRLEKLTLVLFVEVRAKLTSPFPLTSEVTSTLSQVFALKFWGEIRKAWLPNFGAFL